MIPEKISLYPWQFDALARMKNGCILCGGVGSGKSRTSLAYFWFDAGGYLDNNGICAPKQKLRDLYIITTARKRDTGEWEDECKTFGLTAKIDSWNNIGKYTDVRDAFFIFDEQRVIGYGSWTKSFLKIAKANKWILLSATPGDTWMDYLPVFIANGYFRNKTHFVMDHVIYSSYSKYQKVDRYVGEGRLLKMRRDILVNMDYKKKTVLHHEKINVKYDILAYKTIQKTRWNVDEDRPFANASELCAALRKCVNSDPSRAEICKLIVKNNKRAIIFYNFNYELDILKGLDWGNAKVAEWNGHKHEPIPDCDEWVYLVQYTAGAEGWNCTLTDTIIFYSQNYSYKIMIQSSGRIDRLNTPYNDLYYYHLKSSSSIDLAIAKALNQKKNFNEKDFGK